MPGEVEPERRGTRRSSCLQLDEPVVRHLEGVDGVAHLLGDHDMLAVRREPDLHRRGSSGGERRGGAADRVERLPAECQPGDGVAACVQHFDEAPVRGDADRIGAARRCGGHPRQRAAFLDAKQCHAVRAGIDREQRMPIAGERHRTLRPETAAAAVTSGGEGADAGRRSAGAETRRLRSGTDRAGERQRAGCERRSCERAQPLRIVSRCHLVRLLMDARMGPAIEDPALQSDVAQLCRLVELQMSAARA